MLKGFFVCSKCREPLTSKPMEKRRCPNGCKDAGSDCIPATFGTLYVWEERIRDPLVWSGTMQEFKDFGRFRIVDEYDYAIINGRTYDFGKRTHDKPIDITGIVLIWGER